MIRAVIIEDEFSGQELMKSILLNQFKEITIVGIAASVQNSIRLITEQKPNLVIIDVQLLDGLGIEVIDHFEQPRSFELVFVTAYSDYAIHAIKENVVDYILKPISISEFSSGIQKAINQINSKRAKAQETIIPIAISKGLEFLPVSEIVFFEAEGASTRVVSKNRRILSTQSIGGYLETLPKNLFCRTHRSFIVNIKQILTFKKERSGMLFLRQGYTIPVSQRKIKEVMKNIGSLTDNIE